MTLGTLKIKPTKIEPNTVIKQNLNEAVDGSVYGYHFGTRKEFTVQLDFLSEEDKKTIEGLIGQKFTLVFDNGEKYNVRIVGNIDWNRYQLANGDEMYSAQLKLIEVVV